MKRQAPDQLEVWKNVAKGMRWITRFDVQGRESDAKIMAGRTFTLTPFERQINQEKAASPELDFFRNGTFVLVRGASGEDGTNEEEIQSPASLTNDEIEELVQRALADPDDLDQILGELTSAVALDRILEFMVAYDAPTELIDKTREKFHQADGGTVPVRRRAVGLEDTVQTEAPRPEGERIATS